MIDRLKKPTTDTTTTPRRALTVFVVLMFTIPSLAALANTGSSPMDDDEDRDAASPDEWLTFKGDNERSGVAASEAPSVDRVLWQNEYKGSVIYSSPTVWNETVYIGVSGTIRAIWAENGTERWVYDAPNPVYSTPVIDNGVIYAGVNDFGGRGAVAVDALTGTEIWNATIPDFVTSAPVVLGNSVYFGCQNSILYCLKTSDGSQRWNFTADRGILYGALASANGLIYFGIEGDTNDNGKVYAVDANTGLEEWSKPVIGSVWSSPAVAGGSVLFSTAGDKRVGLDGRKGYVYAFNATTGSQSWRTEDLGMVMASPSVKNDRIYVGTFGKFLLDIQVIVPQMYCLDLADGDIIWNRTVSHQGDNAKVWSSVTISGSKIIFGDELGFLNVWNTFGLKIWAHEMRGAAVKTTPAVAEEMVFAANTMGDVFGFGSQPDLAVNASVIDVDDEMPHLGQSVNVRAKISNIGDKTATGQVFLYNGTIDDWHTVINHTTVILQPGRSTYVYAVWTADEVGNRAVWVRIMDVVPNEEDTDNNEALRVIEVLPPAEGWLTSRADPTGIGFIKSEPPGNNITKWLRAEGAHPGGGLVATMETVFYPVGQKLVALERLMGTVEWTQDLGASPTTPAGVGDGAVFVGLDDKTLMAMDLEEGFVRFVRSLDGTITAGPTVVGNMVLVGTDTGSGGGTLYALHTFNGTELWSRDMSAPVMAQPAVWEGMVFALSDNGAIMSLNMTDGALNWQYPVGKSLGSSLTASPAVSDERLFVASTSGYVYCLDADPSDGVDEGKEDPVDSEYDVIWTYKEEDQTPFNASPALVSGNVVLLSGESGVLALNATNGTIAWREDLANTGPLTMDLIAVNGSVVVGGNGVFILDATTGAMTWMYEAPTSVFVSGPAALDDMLFATDDRGILFAFGKVANQPPVARISAPEHDEKFRINETIVFDGSESTDDKELLDTSFKWDFGDGNSTLAMITSHRYAWEGTYTVKLTVTDIDGESDNTSISIRVLGNHDPILDWWDVVPDTGHTLVDPFNFSVRYTDPDNDPPEYVTLLLADEPEYTPVIMEPVDPNDEDYNDGKMYFHIVKPLASRPYPAVTFAASDGIASTELVVKGPVVLQDRTFPNSVGDILVMAVYVGPNNLEYIPVSSPPSTFPPGLFPIGVYTELLLETTFLKAANVSINYTFHDILDIDVDTLAIYRWSVSGEDAGWEYLEDSEVDTSTGIVSAPIPSLQNDIYTVLGNKLNPPPNHRPVAVITVDGKTYSPGAVVERTYKPGDVIEFDGSKSYDPDEDDLNDYIVSYVWSFNDGSAPAEGKLAMHSYDIQDRYEVVLTVRDSFNEEGSVTVIINVKADEGNALLYLIVIVCIVVILILLFYHKGEGTKPAAPKTEPKDPSQDLEETNGDNVEDVEEEDTTELDDIIDELEEDRSR